MNSVSYDMKVIYLVIFSFCGPVVFPILVNDE